MNVSNGTERERIDVACACRRDYLPHTATMLASLLANAGGPVRVHHLSGPDLPDTEVEALTRFVAADGGELIPHRVDESRLEDFGTTSTLPLAHWYRTLLPVLLPELSRVIYLDSDLLVLGPLTELWKLDLAGNALAAVTNRFPDPASGAEYCAALGVDPDAYFNSGVMVLDLDAMREADSFERIREFARRLGGRLILPEQDAMCAVLGDRRLPLEERWNAMVGADPAGGGGTPVIRHFEGSRNKPWLDDAPIEDRLLWDSYRARTPWTGGEAVARG
ncbi:MAG TPA: glycosyltransferase family 8 protein [Solirubrobacterales bacterium]|nr:glycosyltransferase family 8 protein [Solirubrobacterales bacterium]